MATPVNIVLAALGTSGVIAALEGVRSSLAGLTAAAAGATTAFAGFSHGFEIGGQLQDLSARTGQTVSDLVILRRALDTTGVGASQAGMMIGMFQRALSGMSRDQSIGKVWKSMGIDPAELKQLGIIDQIKLLEQAFAKIPNAADRAGAVMRIFGEEGAQMLQLFQDRTAIEDAERDVGRFAGRLQDSSGALDQMGDRLSLAKERMQEFWVVASTQLLPVLNSTANAIRDFNPAVLASMAPSFVGAGFAAVAAKGLGGVLGSWSTKLEAATAAAAPGMKASLLSGLAGLTGKLATILPIGLGVAVAAQIVAGIFNGLAEWKTEKDRQQEEASNAEARNTQAQRDALRHAQSLAEVDAQRKKVAQEIADLEKKAAVEHVKGYLLDQDPLTGGTTLKAVKTHGLNADDQQRLDALKRLQATLNSQRATQIVHENQASAAQAQQLARAQELLAPLKAQAAAYEKAAAAAKYALAPDGEKLQILAAQLKAATDLHDKETAAAKFAGDANAAKLADAKYEATTLSIAKERRDVEKSIADEKTKQAEEAKRQVAAAKQAEVEAVRAHAEAARSALEERQMTLQAQIAQLDADFAKTDAEKWADRKDKMTQALAAAQAYLASMQQARSLAKSEAAKAQADANVHSAQQGVYSAQGSLAQIGPDPNSAPQQITVQMTQALGSIGTLAQQTGKLWASVGESIRTSLGSALNDLWTKTGSVRSKLASFANSIALSFAQSASQMVADWIVSHTILARVRDMFEAQSIASTAAGAGARTTIRTAETGASIAGKALDVSVHVAGEVTKTTATVAGSSTRLTTVIAEAFGSVVHGAVEAFEALASIPYVGPILGAAAMAAALAGGIALVSKIGGHEKGGLVQGKQLSWLAENGDEFVFSAPAVKALGADKLGAMHNAAKSGNIAAFSAAASPAAAGGSRGAGGGSAGRPLNVALVDPTRDRSTMQQLERDPHADTWFVNMLSRHRRTIPGVTI